MKILVYGINYAPELTGVGKYTGEMASWMAKQGHQVRVVTAPPYYPDWRVARGYSAYRYARQRINGVDVFRCPLYVPARPSTIKRILHLVSFAVSSSLVMLGMLRWKPDVIIVLEPSLFCTPAALAVKTLSRARAVLHIQDFELDAMLGLGMARAGWVSKVAQRIERWLMRRFDRVSTISYSMLERAHVKGVDPDKLLLFPNWVDTDFINPAVDGSRLRGHCGFSDDQKLVLYSGNIGNKQGLEMVIEAANALQQQNVQFLMVGQGAYRETLEAMTKTKRLRNVHFKDLVPYSLLPELLAMADIHLVIQRKGAADAVLPSKLTSILAAGGHALITAEPNTELGKVIARYPGIAERVVPEDLNEFIIVLNRILARNIGNYNEVARNYAEQQLRRDAVLSRFDQDIHTMCGREYAVDLIYEGPNNDQ